MSDGRRNNGGKRPGAGRPKGSKDAVPRVTRKSVIESRRSDWDRWSKHKGTLKKAFERLDEIISDKKVNPRETIKAIELLWKYGYGLPDVTPEEKPVQTLIIQRPQLQEPSIPGTYTIEEVPNGREWEYTPTADTETG